MKRRIIFETVFGMTNLVPKKTGLSADIWSTHKGILRNVSHNTPQVEISTPNCSVSVSIEPNPSIIAKSGELQKSEEKAIKEAIEYVGRNHDLLLKHYQDADDSFDDEALFNALRSRGEYQ